MTTKAATFVFRAASVDGTTPLPPGNPIVALGSDTYFLGSFAALGLIRLADLLGNSPPGSFPLGIGGAAIILRIRFDDPSLTAAVGLVTGEQGITYPLTNLTPPQSITDPDEIVRQLAMLNPSQGVRIAANGAGPVFVALDMLGGTAQEILDLCSGYTSDGTGTVPGPTPPTPPAPADGLYPNLFDYSVNHGRVEKVTPVRMIVGSQSNLPGSFNGLGVGNKCMAGVRELVGGAPLMISALGKIRYRWRPKWGPLGRVPFGGVFGSPTTVLQPYCNILVRFFPADVRLLAVCTPDGFLSPALNVGSYTDNGDGTATFEWDPALHYVQVVGAPPAGPPAGVPATVVLGPAWQDRSTDWAAFVAADPTASVVDGIHPDGGVGVGTDIPQVFLSMGDSSNVDLAELELLEFSIGPDIIIA
jgi:hypothetical protein